MALSRLSPRTLIVAAMLASGALAAPVLAPAMAQKAPAGPTVNKNMMKPMNEAVAAIKAQNWADAKAKLDTAYAAAKTPQEKLEVEKLRFSAADAAKDLPGKIAAIRAALATGALSPEDAKPYRGSLASTLQESGDTAGATAAMRDYIDAYGGNAAQYGALATDARKASDWANADKYAQKAIDAAKAANAPAGDIEKYQAFQVHTYWDAKQMDKYNAGMAMLIATYPGKEDYWKELVARAQSEPGYTAGEKDIRLDVYRTLNAVSKMPPLQKSAYASSALKQDLPNEALSILKPAIDSGELGGASDANADLNKKNLADAERKTNLETAGLAKEEKEAAAKGDTAYMATVGEVLLTHAEYARAATMLKAALDKGIADANKADIVRLHLGMAQMKAGDKAAAKATFASIKAENGATGIARIWTMLADKG